MRSMIFYLCMSEKMLYICTFVKPSVQEGLIV